MKYCSDSTLSHPLVFIFPECLISLDALIKYEEISRLSVENKFSQKLVLNLDLVSKRRAKRFNLDTIKSTDFAFFSKDNGGEFVLCEIKLNLEKSIRNLKITSLQGKVDGSKLLLGNVRTSEICYILLNERFIQEARSWLFRLYPKIPQSFQPISEKDLLKWF